MPLVDSSPIQTRRKQRFFHGKEIYTYFYPRQGKPNESLMEACQNVRLLHCLKTGTNYGGYLAFSDRYDMYQWINSVPIEDRTFFEVIQEGYQKHRFDIDISRKECKPENFTLEWAEELKDQVIDLTIEVLKELTKDTNFDFRVERDVALTDSHGADKFSYHIILPRHYFPSNHHCKYICKLVKERLPEIYRRFLDHSVYSKLQEFRLLGSQKQGTGRIKTYRSQWTYHGRTIIHEYLDNPARGKPGYEELMQYLECLIGTIARGDTKFIYFELPKHNQPVLPTENIDFSQEELLQIEALLKDDLANYEQDIDTFTMLEPKGNLIPLRRHQPSYCPICERTHDHENPLLVIVGQEMTVYFKCRRNERNLSRCLGSVYEKQINRKIEILENDVREKINDSNTNGSTDQKKKESNYSRNGC